jgi:hypothetical protein
MGSMVVIIRPQQLSLLKVVLGLRDTLHGFSSMTLTAEANAATMALFWILVPSDSGQSSQDAISRRVYASVLLTDLEPEYFVLQCLGLPKAMCGRHCFDRVSQ